MIFKKKYFLNAPLILFLPFFFVIIFSYVSEEYYPYSIFFYHYLFYSLIYFAFGYFIFRKLRINFRINLSLPLRLSSDFVVNLYLFCMALYLILESVAHYYVIGSYWFLPSRIMLYRKLETHSLLVRVGVTQFQFLLNAFFFTAIPMLLIYGKRFFLKKSLFIILMLMVFIYFSGSRSTFFLIFLIACFYYLLNDGVEFNRKVAVSIFLIPVFLFAAFVFIAYCLGKNFTGNVSFLTYFVAPSHALDQIIRGINPDPDIFYTFKSVVIFLKKIKIITSNIHISSLIKHNLPYFKTPKLTNVYTLFGPYILDYGTIGSLIFIFFFGCISGFLESKYYQKQKSTYVRLLLSLNFSILTLGFFHDFYTSTTFIWIIVIFFWIFFP